MQDPWGQLIQLSLCFREVLFRIITEIELLADSILRRVFVSKFLRPMPSMSGSLNPSLE